MKAARKKEIPIFFSTGRHREDEGTTVLLLTDTNIPQTVAQWCRHIRQASFR